MLLSLRWLFHGSLPTVQMDWKKIRDSLGSEKQCRAANNGARQHQSTFQLRER